MFLLKIFRLGKLSFSKFWKWKSIQSLDSMKKNGNLRHVFSAICVPVGKINPALVTVVTQVKKNRREISTLSVVMD